MTSRDKILQAVKASQPDLLPLPELPDFIKSEIACSEQFETVLTAIGGTVHHLNNLDEIASIMANITSPGQRVITTLPELKGSATVYTDQSNPHLLDDVEVAVLQAEFGVAENGAVWLADQSLPVRVLPFICQHLVVVVNKAHIVSLMQDAYKLLDTAEYGFGVFVAGPSKTADIEQSLVLGAHGPKTMTICLL